jgi:hypothetical protein
VTNVQPLVNTTPNVNGHDGIAISCNDWSKNRHVQPSYGFPFSKFWCFPLKMADDTKFFKLRLKFKHMYYNRLFFFYNGEKSRSFCCRVGLEDYDKDCWVILNLFHGPHAKFARKKEELSKIPVMKPIWRESNSGYSTTAEGKTSTTRSLEFKYLQSDGRITNLYMKRN